MGAPRRRALAPVTAHRGRDDHLRRECPSRRVSARLRHPAPESVNGGAAWTFRATECDIADHVNNAAYWQPLEEELLAGSDPERLDVEIEYRAPAQPGAKRVIGNGGYRWIVGDDDELHASIRLGTADGR